MSTISSGTTLTTALVQTGDTTGDLVIKTGSSNTTAMTISGSDQSVTIAGTLTANGSSITPSQWVTAGSNISYTTGNVGIGTTSANIYSTGSVTNALGVQASGTNQNGLVAVAGTGSGYGAIEFGNATIRRSGVYAFDGSSLAFYTNGSNSGTSLSERMRITSAGSIGIGTNSPLETLDVRARNSTFSTSDEDTNVFITSGYDSGVRYLTRLRTDYFGVFTIATGSGSTAVSPSSNSPTDRLKLDNSGNLKFNSGYGSVATAYGCRAWVNFNGTSSSIRASGNVTSITSLGTGLWQINFTNAMPDASYAVTITGAADRDAGGGNSAFNIRSPSTNYVGSASVTTSYVQISLKNQSGTLNNSDVVTVAIFR